MNAAIRWRIIVLQVVAIFVLALGTVGAYAAYSFTATQIHDQLAPQQIFFPKDAASGLPDNLTQYAGQQVLTGEQAHAYAEKYIGLHLSETGQGHPYSYWSTVARSETDPALKAKDQAIADTMFKGETLKGLLNEAYAFSVFGQIAYYAAIGLALATLVVLGALIFEIVEMVRGKPVTQLTSAELIREPVTTN
jgi:hypothetical protein